MENYTEIRQNRLKIRELKKKIKVKGAEMRSTSMDLTMRHSTVMGGSPWTLMFRN